MAGDLFGLALPVLIIPGLVIVLIGLVVKKFWPQKRGSLDFWILSFEVAEWLSIVVCGTVSLVLGVFLALI